jgi:hypothetical protein
MKEEVIKEVLDVFITFLEANSITREKNEAVKKQDFEKAVTLRTKEQVAYLKLPSLEKIKELRDKL